MEFSAAASFFDLDEIFDAYTDDLLFTGHTTAHDDHTSSGSTARRRTLITGIDSEAPARHAIRWYDSFWLIGDSNTDAFQGSEVRRNFALKKSTGIIHAMTPGNACLGVVGAAFHAHKEYYRDMTDALTSADYDLMWNVFCPLGEPVVKGTFLVDGGLVLRVRNAYTSIDGFIIAESDQLDADARQSATFLGAPGLDFDTAATAPPVTVDVIQSDVSKFYVFRTEAESVAKPGDKVVFVAKSAVTPKVDGRFTMQGATWRVVTVVPEQDAYALRVRLA